VADRDTSADAAAVQVEVLRRLGPARRAEIALGMSEDMRGLVRARIDRDHPELDERGRVRALVAYLYGEDLAAKAFG
jgi:hypothetical protein